MDLGDWQELSRLRLENHVWHRCIDEIREAMEQPGGTSDTLAAVVRSSVVVLNERLAALHRRPVTSHQ
jgi:hypothetical protein